jgi:hypothetical protein
MRAAVGAASMLLAACVAAAPGPNPFGVTTWATPAPPAPAAPAPAPEPAPPLPAAAAPPVAPALPFRFLGRYRDGRGQTVLLVDGERLHVVGPGDTIDGTWRVERVTGQLVELTYLPMQLKQSLSTGDPG